MVQFTKTDDPWMGYYRYLTKHSMSYRGAPERRGGIPNKKKKKVHQSWGKIATFWVIYMWIFRNPMLNHTAIRTLKLP